MAVARGASRVVGRRASRGRRGVAARAALTAAPARTDAEVDALADELEAFLREDLTHLFDDKGIDASAYAPGVKFEDPITRYDSVEGYVFNIGMLKNVFKPEFELHGITRTGRTELTTRWTMTMSLWWSPFKGLWQPELTFTGTSIMGFDAESGKFVSHRDTWDSIDQQGYFSREGLEDLVGQVLTFGAAPADLDTPKYRVLRRARDYEVREYPAYLVAESLMGDGAAPSSGGARPSFMSLVGYISGANEDERKIQMTTPVFTEQGRMQFMLPAGAGAPAPLEPSVAVREQPPRVLAARRFNGFAADGEADAEERRLVDALARDGLAPCGPGVLARYNDPSTPGWLRRNEVLLPLEGFELF